MQSKTNDLFNIFKTINEFSNENKQANKTELAKYINAHTGVKISKEGTAINTLIRQTYNYLIQNKLPQQAFKLMQNFPTQGYDFKINQNYNLKKEPIETTIDLKESFNTIKNS